MVSVDDQSHPRAIIRLCFRDDVVVAKIPPPTPHTQPPTHTLGLVKDGWTDPPLGVRSSAVGVFDLPLQSG
jgi:hypothetical protein